MDGQTWICFKKWIKIVGFSRLVSLTVFQSSLFLFVHLIQCLGRIDNASPICHSRCGRKPWLSLLLQRLPGLSLEMRWPAIGQFFPCLQWQSHKSFQKLTWNIFLLISNVANWYPLQVYLNRYLKSLHGLKNMPG